MEVGVVDESLAGGKHFNQVLQHASCRRCHSGNGGKWRDRVRAGEPQVEGEREEGRSAGEPQVEGEREEGRRTAAVSWKGHAVVFGVNLVALFMRSSW